MKTEIISKTRLGDMEVHYRKNEASGRVELILIPWQSRKDICERRKTLSLKSPEIRNLPEKWSPPSSEMDVDSIIQLRRRGDRSCGGYCSGQTLRDSPDIVKYRYSGQDIIKETKAIIIQTRFQHTCGLECVHELKWNREELGLRVKTYVSNNGSSDQIIELLASFSLGGITPFCNNDAPGRLRLHRYRSNWSNEGRSLSESFEALGLERSWMGAGARTLRFGQVGSLPVNQWFPQAAIEDTIAGITWAAQLCWHGSWQMEVFRMGDSVSLSGGLADRDFGHWWKTLSPGESIESPEARLTVIAGDHNDAARRLVEMQNAAVLKQPAAENSLPVLFNEWCTTWGAPTHEKILAIADRLSGTGVKYLVIDANWSIRGDWDTIQSRFPLGLKKTCAEIRKRGLIPGIWFEFEVAAKNSVAYDKQSAHALTLNGVKIDVSDRHFWDFRDPWTIQYLGKKVINFLKEADFGYLKVDYNASIGMGVDGAESPGEGLRQHLVGVYDFYAKIRKELPHLVLENCSSGGHRLVPNMQELCAVGVFSDAHESVEIPIIAANVQSHILPRQSQVWAVLRKHDDIKRITYSLSATFLGRVALSGDIHELSTAQMSVVKDALKCYHQATPLLKSGQTEVIREMGESYRYPKGYQIVQRFSKSRKNLLLVVHQFDSVSRQAIKFALPGNWKIVGQFSEANVSLLSKEDQVQIMGLKNFSGAVFILKQ